MCCSEETTHSSVKKNAKEIFRNVLFLAETHPYNDADGQDAGRGHDFGAVGDEVEKDGNDGFGTMVELVPQHRGELAAGASRRQNTVKMQIQPSVSFPACMKKIK